MEVAWRGGGGPPVAGHPPSVRMEEPESGAADPLRDRDRIVPDLEDVRFRPIADIGRMSALRPYRS